MEFNLTDANGRPIDARVEVRNGRLFLHSRSGASAGRPATNTEYTKAFNTILQLLSVPTQVIKRVLIDSAPARLRPEGERVLAARGEIARLSSEQAGRLIRARMRRFGRGPEMPPNEGNTNKRLRFDTSLPDNELLERLRLVPAPEPKSGILGARAGDLSGSGNSETIERLRASELRKVRPEHIIRAVARLVSGEDAGNFDPSRKYDAVTPRGDKLSPKKVFGLAIEEVLGIEARPGHFSAGWGTPCFDILENAGLWIVPKKGTAARPRPSREQVARAIGNLEPTDEERSWIEGNPKIATHLRKERKPGLAPAKRSDFIKKHGRLFCERCEMDPAKIYGADTGVACIEVHHHRVQVMDMQPGHETKLDDLMCLCANCHRVLHRELTLGTAGPK